jgi:hypothetical protein
MAIIGWGVYLVDTHGETYHYTNYTSTIGNSHDRAKACVERVKEFFIHNPHDVLIMLDGEILYAKDFDRGFILPILEEG